MTADATETIAGLDLVHLHWDERGSTLFATFEGPLKPPFTPDAPDHDHMRVRAVFSALSHVRVRGWSHEVVDHAEVRADGHMVEGTFSGPGTSVAVTANRFALEVLPTYRKAAE